MSLLSSVSFRTRIRRDRALPGLALLVLIAIAAGVAIRVSSRSGFMADDFVNLWIMHKHGAWTWEYLKWSCFGHLTVGQRGLLLALFGNAGLRWWKAQAAMACGVAISTYLGYRIGRRLRAPQPWPLVCAAVMGLNVLWSELWIYWFAANDCIVSIPFVLLSIELAIVRFLMADSVSAGRRYATTLACVACLGWSLLCRERMAAVSACFLFTCIALYSGPPKRKALFAYLNRFWDLWLSTAICIVIFFVYLKQEGYLANQAPGSNTGWASMDPIKWLVFLARTAYRTLIMPGFGLLPSNWHGSAAPMLALETLVVVCAASIMMARRSIGGWFVIAACSFASYLPVAVGRAEAPGFADVTRYGVEILPFICVGVGLIGRALGQEFSATPRYDSVVRWGAGLLCLGISLVAVQQTDSITDTPAFSYRPRIAAQYRRSLDKLPSEDGYTLVQRLVPAAADTFGGPGAAQSMSARLTQASLKMADESAHRVLYIDDEGSLHRFYRADAPENVKAWPDTEGRICFEHPAELASGTTMYEVSYGDVAVCEIHGGWKCARESLELGRTVPSLGWETTFPGAFIIDNAAPGPDCKLCFWPLEVPARFAARRSSLQKVESWKDSM